MNDDDAIASAKTITHVVYLLQALSFLLGFTILVAVIINYVKRVDVQGTWLASHFRWQIRTFWFSVLWSVVGFFTLWLGLGYLVLLGNGIWILYRIVRGWLSLNDGREMYV